METWRPIKGNEHYFISNQGRVKNGAGRILTPQLHNKGYYKIMIGKYGERFKGYYIHRLVAIAFIDNPRGCPQVNHKDTIKTNNTVDNLEWCTNLENHTHGRKNGLFEGLKGKALKGEDHPFATLKNNQVIEIRQAKITKDFTRKMLCEKYGVSLHIVKDIRSRKSWTHI